MTSMGTVVERMPFDVWFNISRYIPRDVVENLYGVNRSFFKIATSIRYEALSDPYIGALVREVRIEPYLVQPRLKPSNKKGARIWGYICGLLDPHYAERQLDQRVQKRLKKDIRRFTDAISVMPNLIRYSLEWSDTRQYHPELYRAFLSPVLGRIHSSLRHLSLNVPLEMLPSLAPVALPHLEHLGVDLCSQKKSKQEVDYILDSFTVFVNNLYTTLHSLSISTRVPSRSLIIDRFFDRLGSFPHLESFTFSIPFDGVHLDSHAVLVGFLDKHRHTLKRLRFSTSRCSPAESPAAATSKYWIRNILKSMATPYPRLQDVHIEVRPIQDPLGPLMDFLALHAESLDSVTLTERALTYMEVRLLLDNLNAHPYSHQLKQLRIKLKHISPALFVLLATRVPRLSRLELTFTEIMATAAHAGHAGTPAHSWRDELRLFKEVMRGNLHFASWELGALGLRQETQSSHVEELLLILAELSPLCNYFVMTHE